jgi:hypothetical protein
MSKRKQIKQKRQAYWRKVFQQWRKSGLSVREYCRRHKIPETSFYQGRRQLTASGPRSRKKTHNDPFVEVKLAESASACPSHLEIIWAQPPMVKVYGGCEARLLEQTIRLLQEQAC